MKVAVGIAFGYLMGTLFGYKSREKIIDGVANYITKLVQENPNKFKDFREQA